MLLGTSIFHLAISSLTVGMAFLTSVCQAIWITKISSSDLSWTLNLKSIKLAIFRLFPKYKAHSEKKLAQSQRTLPYIHNLWHIHTLFCVIFFLEIFLRESWLNFHIPLHALYLAGKKLRRYEA
ncbi:hypothetical protein C1645_768224 [Glomus cerebriforme]|uniref:Uncharacterized protein n=1 Tax=Glomus cerebriforme TaxID=658196 RepID=A0A397T4U0_9GLOM|nr:hypothetical protein C1645_768224 [Glomus cerebriforme]